MPAMPPPEVDVALPVTRDDIVDYEDFPGRVEAVNSIDIKARVTGYLDKVHFKEGADVRQGDLLFEIDPRLYDADLARAEANLGQAEAHAKRLEADYRRAVGLLTKSALGREDYDKVAGDHAEAVAMVGVARASRDTAKLNVSFTKMTAPIAGRISRRFIDPGNLVKADDTALASIVSLDPIYVYFDVDERTTLRLQRLIREKKIQWSIDHGLPLKVGLADDEGFPKEGRINFADNRVDPDTGTWRLRGTFANPDHCLAPGLFVRVRFDIGKPYRATLVAEQALGTNQGQKYVYVVNDAGMVDEGHVTVGRLQKGLRVIENGLKPNEKIVVSGLQRVRQGVQVQPKLVDMPVILDPATAK